MSGTTAESETSSAKQPEPEQNDNNSDDNKNSTRSDDTNRVSPHQQADHEEDGPSRLKDGLDDDGKTLSFPEYSQVSSRLNQIRGYIAQTTSVMEQLQAAGTPKHIEQWIKLADMLEGLRDSEMKLSAILHTFNRMEEEKINPVPKSNTVPANTNELKMKIEESERKLSELKEQQATLISLKQKARDQLKKGQSLQPVGTPSNDASTAATSEVIKLQNRLKELQVKKAHMDQLVEQLSAFEQTTDNYGTVDSNDLDNEPLSNGMERIDDKIAELAALKQQLHHMQAIMAALPARSSSQEPKPDEGASGLRINQEKQDECSEATLNEPSEVVLSANKLHAKSKQLQEAKAKLQQLQGLLSLVEKCRDSGKRVPDNVLMLLNSNEDDDTLMDLPEESYRDMCQEISAEIVADQQTNESNTNNTVDSLSAKKESSEE